jgi:Flp pilus assembly protein TadD
MARCHLNAKRYDLAVEWSNRALAVVPESSWAYRVKAIALARLKRSDEAMQAATAAAGLAPNDPAAYFALTEVAVSARKMREATAAAEKGLELAPDTSEAHNNMGFVLLKRWRPKRAERHFRKSLELDPNNSLAMNNLGVALQRQGRQTAALAMYAKSSKTDPHEQLARSNATGLARRSAPGFGLVSIWFLATYLTTHVSLGSSSDGSASLFVPVFVAGLLAAGIGVLVLRDRRKGRRRIVLDDDVRTFVRSQKREQRAEIRDNFKATVVPFAVFLAGLFGGGALANVPAVPAFLRPSGYALMLIGGWYLGNFFYQRYCKRSA